MLWDLVLVMRLLMQVQLCVPMWLAVLWMVGMMVCSCCAILVVLWML